MRVVLALLAPLVILAIVFGSTAALLVQMHGVQDAQLRQAIEAIAWAPTSLGFALVLAYTLWCARRDGLGMAAIGWTPPSVADVLAGLAVGLAVAVVDAVWLYPLVQRQLPSFDPTLASQSLATVVGVLVVSIAAEDTLFRGYALVRLRERLGIVGASVLSTLVYAPLAGVQGAALIVWALGFGLLLCAVRRWRGSLWPVVIVHAVVSLAPRLQLEASTWH